MDLTKEKRPRDVGNQFKTRRGFFEKVINVQ